MATLIFDDNFSWLHSFQLLSIQMEARQMQMSDLYYGYCNPIGSRDGEECDIPGFKVSYTIIFLWTDTYTTETIYVVYAIISSVVLLLVELLFYFQLLVCLGDSVLSPLTTMLWFGNISSQFLPHCRWCQSYVAYLRKLRNIQFLTFLQGFFVFLIYGFCNTEVSYEGWTEKRSNMNKIWI